MCEERIQNVIVTKSDVHGRGSQARAGYRWPSDTWQWSGTREQQSRRNTHQYDDTRGAIRRGGTMRRALEQHPSVCQALEGTAAAQGYPPQSTMGEPPSRSARTFAMSYAPGRIAHDGWSAIHTQRYCPITPTRVRTAMAICDLPPTGCCIGDKVMS